MFLLHTFLLGLDANLNERKEEIETFRNLLKVGQMKKSRIESDEKATFELDSHTLRVGSVNVSLFFDDDAVFQLLLLLL